MVKINPFPPFFQISRFVMFSSDITIYKVAPESAINALLSYLWFDAFAINSYQQNIYYVKLFADFSGLLFILASIFSFTFLYSSRKKICTFSPLLLLLDFFT